MKAISIIFYILGGVLLLSVLNLLTVKPPIEGIAYYIGLFVPALICFAIGAFFGGKAKKKI